jgi:type VI secretion system protein ImpG
MDPSILEYYNRELQFMRDMGAEFAQAYPRIAARLGLEGLECADPYVERLLEGFAFLAARVQLKLDARHPEFTQHLLEMVYPQFLTPIPSCAVVEFAPDMKEGEQLCGQVIRRGACLRTPLSKGDRTSCEFRTAHDVALWPVTVSEARYFAGSGVLATQGVPTDGRARAAIRLRLKAAPGVSFDALPIDSLTFFLKGTADVAHRLYEQVVADCAGVCIRPALPGGAAQLLPASCIRQVGFEDTEALLPITKPGFDGYRLLQEYFAFPDRFLFFSINEMREGVRRCEGGELDIYLLLSRAQPTLENALEATHFRLHCTPAVNLFGRAADRIHVEPFDVEHHLVADRNRPMDFEIFGIESLQAVGANGETLAPILPFYSMEHHTDPQAPTLYYTLQRRRRMLSARQQLSGARANYLGNECYVSIVDSARRRLTAEIRQIDAQTLCTNRDLPIQLVVGQGRTDYLLEGGMPVESVRCIAGPSYPRSAPAFGDTAWRLVSHLALNYLSLLDASQQAGAQMLRDLLALYPDPNDAAAMRQIDGVRSVAYRPVVRRMPVAGPISYGRGLEISVALDDAAFEGLGIVALGSVLDRFFARYVSINSFTQTRIHSVTRGEVRTCPVRTGRRQII